MRIARIAAAALAMTMAVALAGCDEENPAGAPSGEFSGTVPPGGGHAPLLDLDPCATLSDSDAAASGVRGKAHREISSDSTRECRWGEYHSDYITVKFKQGDPELAKPATAPGAAIESTVDGRRTLRYTEPAYYGGACASVVVITPGSYVQLLFSSLSTALEKSCAKVDRLLPAVSAKIPRM